MMYPIPINSKGVFTLQPPFENLLTPDVIYTCTAVRRLSDCVRSDEDAFEKYYVPHGLSQEQYTAALMSDECIVSLESSSGKTSYVPNSYISGLPEINGVAYTVMIMAVQLGLVPTSLNLNHVQLKVLEAIKDSAGIVSEVSLVNASDEMLVSQSRHDLVEADRQAAIADMSTDYAKYVRERTLRQRAEAKIAELENYIVNNPRPT